MPLSPVEIDNLIPLAFVAGLVLIAILAFHYDQKHHPVDDDSDEQVECTS